MNNERMTKWINDVFFDCPDSPALQEQKEELAAHLTERVREHMAQGHSYDAAFSQATQDLGDLGELVAGFSPHPPQPAFMEMSDGSRERIKIVSYKVLGARFLHSEKFVALSPFIYVALGLAFGWWWWAWVIIPMSGILMGNIGWKMTTVALTPFIYVLLGFALGGMAWAWGWIIIPVSGILFAMD